MQEPSVHHLWTINKPIAKKQGDRRKIKCKNLVNVVCEQWTNQQQENKMIEKKWNERTKWCFLNVADCAKTLTFSS